MSAIAGIYNFNYHSVDQRDLQQMVDILAHRGSDGVDIWMDDSVGFGHRMLWTTPESLIEKLPLIKNELIITADARIDNRDELKAVLNLPNRPLEEIADSEFILAAYERWGEDCAKHLLGDFAFAIWDRRKQILFCARDHFGVKPFYYFLSNQFFVFATEIKAIFCVPEVPRRVNEVWIGDYLASMFHDTTITSYQNILRLPPAHRIIISPSGARLESYWSLDPSYELHLNSDKEYADAFREIFTEAVRCRLRSAFPLGSMLSGGLDSSSVTCVARKLLSECGEGRLHAFSAVFDQLPECDERSYITPIIAQGGLVSHFIQGNQQTPFENLERIFWHQDEAFYAPVWFMTWALYGAVQAQGVRVMLEGFDGDTTVSHGYGYLTELAQAQRWLTLSREINGLAKTIDIRSWQWFRSYVSRYGLKPKLSRIREFNPLKGMQQKLASELCHRASKSAKSTVCDIINSDFAERIGLAERYQMWRQAQSNLGQIERERHYRNISTQGLPVFALEVFNKTIAAFSIEARYPFWDKRLVEFCLAIPADQKLYRGWDRVVMRRAMHGLLPEAVQWRRGKTDFSPNLTKGLLKNQDYLHTLISELDVLTEYIDRIAVEEIYQRFVSEQSLNIAEDSQILWNVISLAQWLHQTNQGNLCELKELVTRS